MALMRNDGAQNGRAPATRAQVVSDAFKQLGKAAEDVTMLAAQGYAMGQVAHHPVTGKAAATALDWATKMGAAIAEEVVQEARYDPMSAAQAGLRVLHALGTLERQMDKLNARLGGNYRWNVKWRLSRRYQRIQAAAVLTEMQRVANQMWWSMNEYQLVSDRMLQKYNPLGRIVSVGIQNTAPDLGAGEGLFPVESVVYHSELEKLNDVRRRLKLMVAHLRDYAHGAQGVLKGELDDGHASFDSSVVWGEVATYESKVLAVMVTCKAWAELVRQEVKPKPRLRDVDIFSPDTPYDGE